MMSENPQYEFFWGGPFSQWFKCEFKLDGVTFNCAEQAMMFRKAKLFDDSESMEKIMATRQPDKQKALGRNVAGFNEETWDQHKFDYVFEISYAKFSQNRGLMRKLFQVGEREFVEASPFDFIWGIGLDAEKAAEIPKEDWPGQNLLGKAITKARDRLKLEYPKQYADCEKMEAFDAKN